MSRSPVSGIGFGRRSMRAASARLNNAVPALLAAALSVCLIVTLTAVSVKALAAMPIAG